MSTLEFKEDPLIVDLTISSETLTVILADGRSLVVPVSWHPRLAHANKVELSNWRLLGDRDAVEWPDLDEHISIAQLLAGHRSEESKASLNRWLSSRENRVATMGHGSPASTMAYKVTQEDRDRAIIESREKARRDYRWILEASRREGYEEGFQKSYHEAFQSSYKRIYADANVLEVLIGQIQKMLRDLGETVTESDELKKYDEAKLKRLCAWLLERLAHQFYCSRSNDGAP